MWCKQVHIEEKGGKGKGEGKEKVAPHPLQTHVNPPEQHPTWASVAQMFAGLEMYSPQ